MALANIPLVCVTAPAEAREDRPVSCNRLAGIPLELGNQGESTPVSRDRTCKPSAAHLNRVLWVRGVGGNVQSNWGRYAPPSVAEGYCVHTSAFKAFADRPQPISGMGGTKSFEENVGQSIDNGIEALDEACPQMGTGPQFLKAWQADGIDSPQVVHPNIMTAEPFAATPVSNVSAPDPPRSTARVVEASIAGG
ncbi:hypothetical protein [Rhodococcus sp. (in: high G+C Gram-positive bacteria)]|uniref:hypothetical protein n=1 Tax=Rhodococcus sp. TaxID=1831 RepID=UPI003B8A70EE